MNTNFVQTIGHKICVKSKEYLFECKLNKLVKWALGNWNESIFIVDKLDLGINSKKHRFSFN
jgi:hypothetical protein